MNYTNSQSLLLFIDCKNVSLTRVNAEEFVRDFGIRISSNVIRYIMLASFIGN